MVFSVGGMDRPAGIKGAHIHGTAGALHPKGLRRSAANGLDIHIQISGGFLPEAVAPQIRIHRVALDGINPNRARAGGIGFLHQHLQIGRSAVAHLFEHVFAIKGLSRMTSPQQTGKRPTKASHRQSQIHPTATRGGDHDRNSGRATLTKPPLAFDFQATTPCTPEVVQAMAPYWSELWGNPSSRQHRLGLTASAAVTLARRQLAEALAIAPERLIFTSGATEANNLALLGLARHQGQGHVISVSTEHHAVLDPLAQLQREGFRVTLLKPDRDGLIHPTQVEQAIATDTILVSVMAANNDIGVLQPLEAIAEVCRHHAIPVHSDAAQAFGHIPLQPDALGLDLVSLSGHKLYGPKGIGALVVREGLRLQPLQWGGGQEAGLRAGTLPTALIVGFAMAVQLAMADLEERQQRLGALRDQLWAGLQQQIPGIQLNGATTPRLAHNLNVTLPHVNGSRLHRALKPSLICSSGSACSNGEPSHVLQAIGRSRHEAEASLRLSLGRSTTANDIEAVIHIITTALAAAQH